MTLEEFARDLRQYVLAVAENAGNNAGYDVDVFTETVVDRMTQAGEADDCIVCNCDGRGFKVNGFNISSDDDCVDLFVTLYHGDEFLAKVAKSDMDRHFTRLRGFFSRSLKDSFRADLAESSPEFDAADSIHSRRNQITRGRLFFLTDGVTGTKEFEDIDVEGIRFSHHIWDIQRLYRAATSGVERERIDLWFERDFGLGIPCINSTYTNEEYSTFVGFFPGELLARIYEKYGARLLERNVRSFLQARGKINRGIRDTIMKEAHRFLAYNNGISATAERAEYGDRNGTSYLTRAEGFQIVNGGQTTASLYAAVKKDKADVSRISVQFKLTIPNEANAIDQLAPKISLYANSQNKVNTADFSANDPFHLQVEELSRTIWAPAGEGKQLETKWYYERARGSYLDELGRAGTPSAKQRWKAQHPASQKFTKTDLAKFSHSWDQLPHLVSRGAEKNFVEFMDRVAETKPALPDAEWFRRMIGKAILFRRTERLVQSQQYQGYRANIVTYTIGWLSHYTAQRIDLEKLWRIQNLTSELEEAIRIVSKFAYDHLVKGARGGNVTEWAKKEKCWEEFRTCPIEVPRGIPLQSDGTSRNRQPAEQELLTDSTRELYADLLAVPANTWFALSHWAKETSNLAPWQRGLAFSLGRLAGTAAQPSIKQLRQGQKILEEARRLGFRTD